MDKQMIGLISMRRRAIDARVTSELLSLVWQRDRPSFLLEYFFLCFLLHSTEQNLSFKYNQH